MVNPCSILGISDDKGHTILNPIVLVEVLSPSTAQYDCTDKLEFYKQIASLRADRKARRLCAETTDGVAQRLRRYSGWAEEITSGAIVLESIECTLALDEVYRDPFAPS